MKRFRQRLCCGYPESDTAPQQNFSTPNPSAQQPSDSSAGASSNTELDTTLPQSVPRPNPPPEQPLNSSAGASSDRESDTTLPQNGPGPNPPPQQPLNSSAGASSDRESDTTLPQNGPGPNPPPQQPPDSSAGTSGGHAPYNAPSTRTMFDEISNVEELKKLLGDIDKEISRQETNKGSDRKAKALKLTADNVKDAEDLFAKFATSCRAIPFTDVAKESRKVIKNLLQGLGSLHWAATGFSMIAFVLTRLDQVGSNFDTCITILKILRDLGHHVVNLDPLFDDKERKLQQAIALISKGAILCAAHMNENSFKRFALTGVSKSNFEGLQAEIRQLYPDLTLSVLIQQATFPLAAQEHEDPPEYTIALDEKVEEVLRLLGMADEQTLESGVKAITLHGMGGIGKSTLANAVCKRLPFTERSFVKVEIGMFRDDNKILERQHDILERLSGQKQRIGDFAEGQRKLKSYLRECKDPVLFFLDSVEHESDLTKLLPKGNFSEILRSQSRIIVTSRDERMSEFFIDRGITSQKYSVQFLEPLQSKEFFTRQVFGDQAVPPDREQPVNQVLKGCDGLPLALEVTGRYLRRHKEDVRIWDTVISYLKNMTELDGTKEDKLVKSLSFSYDFLSEHNQIVFLDIVGLLRNFEWETVDSIYGKELADLKSLALVKKLQDSFETERVGVHDLIVALGHRNQPSPTTRIRVDVKDFAPKKHLPDDYEGSYGNVQGLVVKCLAGFIPAETLDAMSRFLRILILEDVKVHGKCTKSPRCLRVCSTSGTFPFDNLAVLKELRVLKVSQNEDMSLDDVELPSRLEVLHLNGFDALQSLPATVPELSSLHTLKLEYCSNLQVLPTNFGQLGSLRTFVITACDKLKALPGNFKGLHSLQHLRLWGCEQLRRFPEGFEILANLRILQIYQCKSLSRLPDEVLNLQSLQVLMLCSCEKMQEPRCGFENLTVLQTLDLSMYDLLTKLPDGFSHLSSLQVLNLAHCKQLQELPDDFPLLTQLKSLKLSGCSQLCELPRGFWNLMALEKLSLDKCTGLKSLPSDFPSESPVTRLKSLDLSECPLQEIPEGFGRLITLERLVLNYCEGLTKLPDDDVASHLVSSFEDAKVHKHPLRQRPSYHFCLSAKFLKHGNYLETVLTDVKLK